jgi:hypothetical protein
MSEQNDKNDGIKDPGITFEYTIKDGWKRISRFVKKHPTISTSVVTGVISWKMSKRHTIKKVAEELYDQTYNFGHMAGELQMQNAVLLDFINENNLGDQVREFIREHITIERT